MKREKYCCVLALLDDVDVWTFETNDGRSLMKSIDWITPYATGAQKWPYGEKVPHPISWTSMFEVGVRSSAEVAPDDYCISKNGLAVISYL